MDKYKSKQVLNFFASLKDNGVVCKEEVLTLESAIGDDIITSSVNTKELTTSPSRASYDEVYAIVNKFIKSENITTNDVTSADEAMRVYNTTLTYLKNLKYTLTQVSAVFSDEVKSKMLDSKHRHSFYNEHGEVETHSYDIMEDYNGPRALLFNQDFIASFSSIPSEKVIEVIKNNLCPDLREPYTDSWYNREIYGIMPLLINNEVSSVLQGNPAAYIEVNTLSYVNTLSNTEEIIKTIDLSIAMINIRLTDIISGVKNNQYIGLEYINHEIKRLRKFNTIYEKDRSTIKVFGILTSILSQ